MGHLEGHKVTKPDGKPLTYLSFDDGDVAYLVANFDSSHLKNELKTAEIEEAVANQWGEDDNVVYWREYAKVCRKAMDAHRARQPKPVTGKVSVTAVKEAHNIVDVVNHYTRLRKVGGNYKGVCPFHDDKQPSLTVSDKLQKFHCFSCERRGDVVDFVREIENTDVKGACRLLVGGVP